MRPQNKYELHISCLPWGLIKANWFICRVLCTLARACQCLIVFFEKISYCIFQSQYCINPDTEIRGWSKANISVGPGRISLCCPGGAALITRGSLLSSAVCNRVRSVRKKLASVYISETLPSLCSTLYGEFYFGCLIWYRMRNRGVCMCVRAGACNTVGCNYSPWELFSPRDICLSIKTVNREFHLNYAQCQ